MEAQRYIPATSVAQAAMRLPATAHIGGIHLRVLNLRVAAGFYADIVGVKAPPGTGGETVLTGHSEHGATVRLTETPDAPLRAKHSAGLFHIAFRYPDRRRLAAAMWRLVRAHYPIGGAADHLVSEAVYLEDPDGNGVELSCDRPRDSWPRRDGAIEMATEPLDVDALMEEAPEEAIEADGRLDIGHIHLQVTDLARSGAFYHDVLGLDVTQNSYPGALFLSAGGYHHHLGLNTWSTRGGVPADGTRRGMISFTIRLGDTATHTRLGSQLGAPMQAPLVFQDPDQIAMEILP